MNSEQLKEINNLVEKQKYVNELLCQIGSAKDHSYTITLYDKNKKPSYRVPNKDYITEALLFYNIDLKEQLKELGYEE